MEPEPMNRLIRSLHKLAQPAEGERIGDAQLLERFVASRDQAAFELLLWRYGPMVLGVCRRVMPDPHHAEDAFQATWLTFVKKAAAIVHRQAVGSWLYQVAHRVALRARAERAKRDQRERPDLARVAEAAGDSVAPRELGQVLDEEVNRLPARQRAAFVLCCVEGRTGEEVARELGCRPGTVSSRLTRAREQLRRRLTRRGLAPAIGALSAALAGVGWHSPVSAALADTTVKATTLFLSGAPVGGALSQPAVTLAEGVLRAMFVRQAKLAALAVLAMGLLALGGVLTHHALSAAPPAETQPLPKPPRTEAAPAPPAAKVPRELLEKRRDMAASVFKQNTVRYRAGQGLPSELFSWSERWLEAELALSDKKADQTAALQAHVDRTRELEHLAIAYARTGQGRPSDADAATYERVNAEIRFFQVTGKLPAPAPETKTPKLPPPGLGEGRR
jgi:RNA polymerase sigma factor (sigma-70 family)